MATYSLTIDGMGCDSCVKRVSNVLKESGFQVLSVSINNALIQTGFSAENVKKSAGDVLADAGYLLVSVEAE